jgi:hypothetical protein
LPGPALRNSGGAWTTAPRNGRRQRFVCGCEREGTTSIRAEKMDRAIFIDSLNFRSEQLKEIARAPAIGRSLAGAGPYKMIRWAASAATAKSISRSRNLCGWPMKRPSAVNAFTAASALI